jgi:hypothetical protein
MDRAARSFRERPDEAPSAAWVDVFDAAIELATNESDEVAKAGADEQADRKGM